MDIPRRKGVSPIIATLLLIAIAVAAGIIVYVFVNGLAGNLTKSGGNQVTEQISLQSYNFQNPSASPSALTVYLGNTGTGSVEISTIYLDGSPLTASSVPYSLTPGSCLSTTLFVGASCSFTAGLSSGQQPFTSGTSHSVKIITSDGGIFEYNVIAGSSG